MHAAECTQLTKMRATVWHKWRTQGNVPHLTDAFQNRELSWDSLLIPQDGKIGGEIRIEKEEQQRDGRYRGEAGRLAVTAVSQDLQDTRQAVDHPPVGLHISQADLGLVDKHLDQKERKKNVNFCLIYHQNDQKWAHKSLHSKCTTKMTKDGPILNPCILNLPLKCANTAATVDRLTVEAENPVESLWGGQTYLQF